MYHHLLVPIDGSTLGEDTVEQAVAFARAIGARITFFHARPDFAASADGALIEVVAPEAFAEAAQGNARAILARAEAAATASGVIAASVVRTCDRFHEAILETAEARRCDLIFMASHGRRGLKGALNGSVTRKVLQDTTLPVLVARVASNIAQRDDEAAIAIIKSEHRSLAAVLQGLKHVADKSIREAVRPDFELLNAMLFYIQSFPERLHRPKEDVYLFEALRRRTDELAVVLAELEKQHVESADSLTALREALSAYEAGASGAAEVFADRVERFAQGQWQHMHSEEELVIPAARRYLTATDWAVIAHAFAENGDPQFDTDTGNSFELLFARLMHLTEPECVARECR